VVVTKSYLLECNTMQSTDSQTIFLKNISSSSSGLKNNPSQKLEGTGQ
jgi:hypothetical protein